MVRIRFRYRFRLDILILVIVIKFTICIKTYVIEGKSGFNNMYLSPIHTHSCNYAQKNLSWLEHQKKISYIGAKISCVIRSVKFLTLSFWKFRMSKMQLKLNRIHCQEARKRRDQKKHKTRSRERLPGTSTSSINTILFL